MDPAFNALADGDPVNTLNPTFLQGGPTLSEPKAIAYGPHGNIFVLEGEHPDEVGNGTVLDIVYEYSGTGEYIGPFVERKDYGAVDLRPANAFAEARSMIFGPDGSGGLGEPLDIKFGPDGNLWVISSDESIFGGEENQNGRVLRFNADTGAFVDIYALTEDENGNQYDPYSFIFFFKSEPVPVLDPWMIAVLITLLLATAGVFFRRRKSTNIAA